MFAADTRSRQGRADDSAFQKRNGAAIVRSSSDVASCRPFSVHATKPPAASALGAEAQRPHRKEATVHLLAGLDREPVNGTAAPAIRQHGRVRTSEWFWKDNRIEDDTMFR